MQYRLAIIVNTLMVNVLMNMRVSEMNEKHWRISSCIRRIETKRRQVMERSFEEFGVTPSQHFVLMQLGRMGDVPSQVQIAEEMHVTPASIARTVKCLDAEGFIARNSGSDVRRNEIHITPKGWETIERSRSLFRAIDERVFQGFAPEELNCLSDMLERMLFNLSQLEEENKRR